MDIDELKNRMEKDVPSIYSTILINGGWGIGKTYFIKKYLEINKPIYISLFGINSIDDFKNQLILGLNKVIGGLSKIYKEISKEVINIPFASISIPYIQRDVNKIIEKKAKKKDIYIIIDDLERKKSDISMETILGIIESFKDINNVVIVLVANETEIDIANKDIYLKFKEKVIQKTYNVTAFSKQAISEIITKHAIEINKIIKIDRLEENLFEFANKHSIKNLRTLERSLIFTKFILKNLNINNYTKEDINNIIIATMAVAIENIDEIYLKQERNKTNKNDGLVSEIMKNMNSCIIKYYFKDIIFNSSKYNIVDPIINIYNDKEIEYNFDQLENFFVNEHRFNTKGNIPLFYKNESELRESIQNFYDNFVLKVDTKISIDEWFKKFSEVYTYSKLVNMKDLFTEKKLKKAILNYIKNINKIDYSMLYIGINRAIYIQEKDEFLIKINKFISQNIETSYYARIIESMKKNENINYQDIDLLFDIYSNKNMENKSKLIKELKENEFFIPNLSDELNEETWGFTHHIWEKMSQNKEDRTKDFEKIVYNQYNNSNILGRYRINSLNKQYNIVIEEKSTNN